MALTSAEKQRRRRERPEVLREVEAKFRHGNSTKMVSVNLDLDVVEGMEEVANYFGLSGRSRTTQLNSMLRARQREAKDLIGLCEDMVDQRPPGLQAILKAMVLEIFLLGGSRKDAAEAHEQLFAQAQNLALLSDDLSITSGQVDLRELEAVKFLKKVDIDG